jgi:plastocyanin
MQAIRASRSTVQVRAQAKPVAKLNKIAQVAGVAVSSLALTLAAHADVTVKLGADSGALVFDPATVTIKSGETVTFKNNAGFPHNVVFDEDEVPVSRPCHHLIPPASISSVLHVLLSEGSCVIRAVDDPDGFP